MRTAVSVWPSIDPAGRKLHVLDPQGGGNLGGRDVVRTHLVRIDPDVYLPFLSADDRDLADAVDRFDAFLDLVLCDLRHFAKRCRCGDRNPQNRRGVGIEFLNRRLLGRFGQIWNDGLDAVLDLLRRDVYVLFEDKRDEDLRDALDRSRAQLVDTGDRIDGFLDLLGDLGLDLLRRSARDLRP